MPALPAFLRPRLSANVLMLFTALWLTVFCNQRLWGMIWAVPMESALSLWLFRALMAALIFAFALGLMLPLSFRGLLKPWLVILLLMSASANVLTVDFGAVADRHAIASVFETDQREAQEMMSAWVLTRIFLLGVLPAIFIALTRIQWQPFKQELLARWKPLLLVVAPIILAITLAGQQVIPFVRNHPEARYLTLPFSVLSAIRSHLQHTFKTTPPHQRIGEDAHQLHPTATGEKPRVLVVVVGESARSESFALAGYPRDTNPALGKLPVLFFANVQSCGTNTATSLPCMFSDLGRENYQQRIANHRDNALDILQRAGWQVEWFDNNTGSKKVAARISESGWESRPDPRWCIENGCHDGLLQQYLTERLAHIERDTVIVLHMLGSHGPAYYQRYPQDFARFLPECRSTQLQSCSREAILNTYDNTIAYTDHVLAAMIQTLDNSADIDGALLYVSDHGESTGEKGLYLHGAPYALAPEQQTRVPMLIWASPHYAQRIGLDMRCLAAKQDGQYSHDHFFDTLLGLGDIGSNAQRSALDISHDCRR
ncbi:phosphoethanolamine transferase [Lysobacteraceae bacterium NML120232]|nr:phosphoethanolamine transferase [Xanthomonadaceae bacterium NML08-0793]PJK12443.1 phosphoethanolamine transferase [Xanthomonadaceae bacterium NML120232]